MTLLSPEVLQTAYLEACEAELRAFKPGNVSIHSEGHDMTVEDFRRSAQVSAVPLCDPALSLGEKIFRAIEATRTAVGCNTNLGIVLLAAPLLQAGLQGDPGLSLRENLQAVLDQTTVADADWVYRAIRLAAPGGLGSSDEQDVHSAPQVTLAEAMRIAAGRDRIAWQYTNYYSNVLDLAVPRYDKELLRCGDEDWAALAVFVELLKQLPDSHVERKFGARYTRMVADRMALVDQALSDFDRSEKTLQVLREVDAEFKSAGINPGTTADLTVACLLTVRLLRRLKSAR